MGKTNNPMGERNRTSTETIVIFAAVEWQFIAQAQHIFAREFGLRGYRVIFVEPIPHRFPSFKEAGKVVRRLKRLVSGAGADKHKLPVNVTVVSPWTLPETNPLFIWCNRLLFLPVVHRLIRKRIKDRVRMVQVWKPLAGFHELARRLRPDLMVYSCIDNYRHENKAPSHYDRVEDKLVRESDMVVAKSSEIINRLQQKRPTVYRRDTGVDFELFSAAARGRCTKLQSLIFFGAISDRLDFSLIFDLANAGMEVHLLGPMRRVPFGNWPEKVQYHPPVPYEEVPALIGGYDGIVLPYAINAYTRGIYLMKLYECLATGKPIFATRLPSLVEFHGKDLLYFIDGADDLMKMAPRVTTNESVSNIYERRRILASKHSWGRVVETELHWMQGELARKSSVEQ
jgi:glycosyltransferase involved in cell wall biosynthesis